MSTGERGSVTALVAVLIPALVACAGLALDGGRMLAARREAQEAADAAARVAADELQATVGGSAPVVATSDARAAGAAYLRTAGYDGEVTVSSDGAARVEVTVEVDMVLLGVVGVGPRDVVAVGRAEPVFGVGGERP